MKVRLPTEIAQVKGAASIQTTVSRALVNVTPRRLNMNLSRSADFAKPAVIIYRTQRNGVIHWNRKFDCGLIHLPHFARDSPRCGQPQRIGHIPPAIIAPGIVGFCSLVAGNKGKRRRERYFRLIVIGAEDTTGAPANLRGSVTLISTSSAAVLPLRLRYIAEIECRLAAADISSRDGV